MKNLLLKTTGAIILMVIVLIGTLPVWTEKGILVSFNQETNTDIEYRVYYTLTEEEKFNHDNHVEYQANATEKEIKFQIPEAHIAKFRLDPGVKPGEVTISNLKLVGDKVIEFDDFNIFVYSQDIDDKTIESNKITIVSNKNDPYIIYKNIIDLNEGTFVNIKIICLIGFISFILGFILSNLLLRKKEDLPTPANKDSTKKNSNKN